MVANIVPHETAEPIFREWLQEIDDRRLEAEALTWIWLCETRKDGFWEEEMWRRDCVKRECQRRERPEIFLHAQQKVFAQVAARTERFLFGG